MKGVGMISEADVRGRTVLVRVDLNAPIRDGVVSDETRIARVAPGIAELAARGAKVVVLSHLGRPKGQRLAEATLRPVAEVLERHLGRQVVFAGDCVGAEAEAVVGSLADGEVAMLENLRFHAGEEKGDPEFVRQLAKLGDIYVNDAFSAAHRAHASIAGLAALLPAFAGPTMAAELCALEAALECPKRPTAALVGGAKISSKIAVIENLLSRMDRLIIGGGMANTFLLAEGHGIGTSLVEHDMVAVAERILAKARDANVEIILPVDVVVAEAFAANAPHALLPVDAVPESGMILDVGPASVARISEALANSATLLWNGPLGAFELAPFGTGTFEVARAAADLVTAGRLVAVAGGGDTVAALNGAGVTERFTYVSTAGGAFLEWLEGREMPGVAALKQTVATT
ncbi:MAG: phosphoglycerate kinase [Hyphomicrobiaceae bacterium]|nr:phosphoglycerate kinase [Hyphomicrobiaceae bacterium]